MIASADSRFVPDSPAAWRRLVVVLALGTLAAVGMWSVVVALPVVQQEFGGTRADASLAYTVAMMGFGIGNVVMGRITDRLGIVPVIALGIAALGLGYSATALAVAQWQFAALHFFVGFGAASTFGPLMVEVSHWFERRRGVAVAIAASGNYLAGAIWPPLIERGIAQFGWRWTHVVVAIVCVVASIPLLAILRGYLKSGSRQAHSKAMAPTVDLRIGANPLTAILAIAGVACCVAMSMPQVHIVAYCADLGYGMARGAEMLAMMLGAGMISRVTFGFIADRIGGLRTLLVSSILQGIALAFYLFFDGLTSLYLISIMFGLFQGGIVPSYAMIVRETMPSEGAGVRVGIVIFATVIGMSLGGWISGLIFDITGSYAAAFLNGLAWNLFNGAIALWLVLRSRPRLMPALA